MAQQATVGARRVIYLAHPVAPTEAEIAETAVMVRALEYDLKLGDIRQLARRANVIRAQEILMALRREFTEVVFHAPWIACLLHEDEDDDDPAQREAGLADNEELVLRSDAIALTGVRLSGGVRREDAAGMRSAGAFTSYDLVGVITIATDVPTENRSRLKFGIDRPIVTFDAWASSVGRVTRRGVAS